MFNSLHFRTLLVVVALAGLVQRAGAQSSWDGGANTGNWADGNNWNVNGVPGTVALTFDADTANNQFTINLGANRTATSITFGAATPANGFTFNNNTLTVNGGITNNDDQTQTFNSTVATGGNQTWNAASGGLTFSNVTLSNTLTFSGANAISINGTMTTAAARTLTLSGSGIVGITTLTIGGNLTLSGSGTSAASITTLNLGSANRTLTNSRSAGTTTISNVSATNRRLTLNGTGTTSIGNVSLGTGGITQNNATGTTLITGTNSSTGQTIITAGTLIAASSTALGDTTNNTTVASGATLGVQGGVTIASEAIAVAGGTGVGGNGAIRNVSGNNTLGGTITYGAATTIGSTSGTLTLSGLQTGTNRALTFTGAGNTTVSGAIQTGTGTLTKTGTGTLTLSGINTYSGTTAISGGTLIVANDSALGSNTNGTTIAASTTLGLQGGINIATENFTSVIGTGTDGLVGAINNISGNNTLGGAITLVGDTRITSTAGTLTLGGTQSGAFALTFGGASDIVVSGSIQTGAGTVTKVGTGTTTLSGASNNYTGLTSITAGTLIAASNSALGSTSNGVSMSNGATLAFQGGVTIGAEAVSGLQGTGVGGLGAIRNISGNNSFGGTLGLTGATTIGSTADTLTLSNTISGGGHNLTFVGAGNTTVSGSIQTSAGTVTKEGTGTLTLSGTSNNYTGLTTVSAGTLNIQNATALGTTANGTTVSSGAALELQGGITVAGETLALNGQGTGTNTGALRNVSGTNIWDGDITLGSSATVTSVGGELRVGQHASLVSHETNTVNIGANTLTLNSDGGTMVFNSRIEGTGSVVKIGTGTASIAGQYNTYTGTTTVNDGTLLLATRGYATPNQGIMGNVVVGDNSGTAGSAIFRYDSSVPGGNRIADTVNIRVNNDGLFDTNGVSDLVGSLTLQGGQITTGAGTLQVGGNISFLTSAQLATITGNITLNGAVRTIDVAANTSGQFSGTLNTGGIIKTGAGTLILTSTEVSAYEGTTTINAGVISARGATALGLGNGSDPASGTEVNANAALQLQGGVNIAAEYLTLGSTGVSDDGGLRSVSGNNAFGGSIVLDAASRINTDADTLTLNGATMNLSTFGLNVGGSGNTDVSRVITSNTVTYGDLTKDGTGTLFLSGNNTYYGNTLVTQGAVNISNSGALGGGPGTTTISSNAALQIQGGITTGETISLSGTGQSNTGAIRNLSGNNTLSGSLTVTGGSATIGSDAGTLTMSGTTGGAGQNLTFTGAGNTTVSGSIQTGSGTVTKEGTGTLRLSGANTYTGLTTVTGGTVELGANNAIVTTNSISLGSSGTFDLNGFNQTLSTISGTGAIAFGGGNLTLTGASLFGGSFLENGTLVLNAGSSLTLGTYFNNSSLNIVLNGGTLNLNGQQAVFGSLTVNSSSILDFSGNSIVQFTSGVTANANLSVTNWTNTLDYFYSSVSAGTQGQAPLNNIVFTGFTGNQTTWQNFDSGPYNDNQITPVPEPEVYGAALVSGLLGLAAWRRRKAKKAA